MCFWRLFYDLAHFDCRISSDLDCFLLIYLRDFIAVSRKRKWRVWETASARLYHRLDLQTLEELPLHLQVEQTPDQSALQPGRPALYFHLHRRSACFHQYGENGWSWKATTEKRFNRAEVNICKTHSRQLLPRHKGDMTRETWDKIWWFSGDII